MQTELAGQRLKDRVAVVVGGAGGIGSAIAERLATEGAKLVVLDIDGKRMQHYASTGAYGNEPLCLEVDITQAEQLAQAAQQVRDLWQNIDVLVNSAGISGRPLGDGPVDACPEDTWLRVISTNLTGVYLTCKYFIPLFNPVGGSVIHLASDDALIGPKPPHDTHAYCASKGGIIALTKAMAISYAPRRIRVNAIAPGWVMTPMTKDLTNDPEVWQEIVGRHPIGRAGTPEDIAAAAAFLAAAESSFITGVVLPVEGGATVW
jgi:NAD(P)-dependent dehydrogenase (short-subunit alcohol dehydrogenase family)